MSGDSWRNRKTLILGRADMIGLLTPAEYNDRVEHAFRMHGLGRVYMEPKGHIVLDRYPGEWEVMPSYIEEPEAAACKWVSIREDNAKYGLPAVFSILVYTHPETGFPLAICDGSHHTLMRTGASAAVSAKWLARSDSTVLAIAGTGSVAKGTLATCDAIFPFREVRIWSRTTESLDRFMADEQPLYPHLELKPSTDLEQVVRGADVVVTGTHARGWIVDNRWIEPGTHLAALGADLEGEQELDPRILQRARVFVDDIRQCRTDGEINVPLRAGLISEEDIAGEIGKVICGELEGRQSDDQVTVFDSTGIALQDSATVPLEYERARAAGVGIEKKMIST
jgi:alanine dehydrogenase